MKLQERIQKAMVDAMKAKQEVKVSTIRMIRSAIKYAEIEKKKTLEDKEILLVLQKLVKQRNDSIEQFEKAKRNDLVEKEKEELKIIEEFLPPALSKEELIKIIDQMAQEISASSIRDMGKLMKSVMSKVEGRADGRLVSELVKEKLS